MNRTDLQTRIRTALIAPVDIAFLVFFRIVFAHARGTVNGRKTQLMVDSTVDLAREPRNLKPARWIIPLSEPLRIRTRNASGTTRSAATN